jgi:osmoprotectant transport system ATP-binding protein
VGRDRGLRSLSFDTAADLPVRPIEEAAGLPLDGVTFTRGDSLRLVIDLTITSPAGVAVRAGADGKPDGVVTHHDIVDHLAQIKGQK